MKTYAEKNFSKDYLKGMNIQEVGVYYNVPIKDIYEDKRSEFDYEDLDESILLDKYSIDSGYYVENFDNIEYEYTDEVEIEDTISQLMNYEKYNHYLVVLFNSTWNNASGYKIFDKYDECFYRSYDNTMKVIGSSKSGKYLELREYHHDKPMGHKTIIVGLTEKEYKKLDKMAIQDIIDFGAECLGKVEEIEF